MKTTRRLAAAAAALLALAGCDGAADLLSPGSNGPQRARLALEAHLPALAQQQQGAPALRVATTYERADGTTVPLGAPQTIALTDARSQDVPVPVDLGACLADAQRAQPTVQGQPSCTVRLVLTLLLGERTLDQQTVGPFALQPGATIAPPPVTLFEVATVRLEPAAGAVTRPDGSIRLEVGATSGVAALALDPSGATIPGRTVAWSTSNPAVATVSAAAGAGGATVTGVAPGTARIAATVNGRTASIDYAVVPRTSAVTVVAGGTGSGTIVSTPAGIACRIRDGLATESCTFAFPGDASVTLQAVAQAGSVFVGWGEACAAAGAADRCTLTAEQARTVRATFAPERALRVSNAGDGRGVVGSVPAGITCRFGPEPTGACSAPFAEGTSVTLTAAAESGDAFLGWTGACEGTTSPTCTVTVGATTAVGARFARPQALTVEIGGTGEGSVAGGPIACERRADATGGACSVAATAGTVVTLTATPAPNSTFAGWTGACSGTGPCAVTADRAQTVGATFTRRQVTLTVALSGAGAGVVSVAGERCTLDADAGSQSCTLRVDVGRPLTLVAAPATGSTFGTWSGACAASAGTRECTLTLAADASVGATFVPAAVKVTIVGDANTTGVGTVTSASGADPRLACTVRGASTSGTCEALVPVGATLVLDAAHDGSSTFGSWLGACAGTSGTRCSLTVRAATTVGVRFLRQQAVLDLALSGTGAGALLLGGAPACTLAEGQGSVSCTRLVDVGTSVSLTLVPATGSAPLAWGGACAEVPATSPCVLPVTSTSVAVTGAFRSTVNVVTVRPAPGYRGGGRVQSSDEQIDCEIAPVTGATSGRCSAAYTPGSSVLLGLTQLTMSRFRGAWSGACTSTTQSCSFSAPAGGGVVTVSLPEEALISLTGTGAGVVTVQVPGDTATHTYVTTNESSPTPPVVYQAYEGQTVTIAAASEAANGFRQWTGTEAARCAAGPTSAVCQLTIPPGSSGGTLQAAFDFAVAVRVGNDAGGTVTVQGITGPTTVCTRPTGGFTNCVLRAPTVTPTLVATPVTGSEFASWSEAGNCTTLPTCQVDLRTQSGPVQANFGPLPIVVQLLRDGASTGSGTVQWEGGACHMSSGGTSGTCADTAYGAGARTYVALPDSGSLFAGWGGLCAGQTGASCLLPSVAASGTVSARFTQIPASLVLGFASGSAPGTIAIQAQDAECTLAGSTTTGNACAGITLPQGPLSAVASTATSGVGFVRWTEGPCAGSSAPICGFSFSSSTTLRGYFGVEQSASLELTALGGAQGEVQVVSAQRPQSVYVTPTDSSFTHNVIYYREATLTLTAVPTDDAVFIGWSNGPCATFGSNPVCTLPNYTGSAIGEARFGYMMALRARSGVVPARPRARATPP